MTKYFELQETPELKYAPRIKNLFGKFDIRTIQLETYPKIPDRQVFIVEPSNKTIFTGWLFLFFTYEDIGAHFTCSGYDTQRQGSRQ